MKFTCQTIQSAPLVRSSAGWLQPAAIGGARFKTRRFTINQIAFAFLCVTLLALCAGPAWGDQCSSPSVGRGAGSVDLDTSGACAALITVLTVDDTGKATSFSVTTTGVGTYDGFDDILVGVQNSSGGSLSSLPLTSSSPIFGFDGDGPCFYNESDCFGPTGYEGPDNTFTPSSTSSGTVNFTSAIPNGGNTWFALEGTPSALLASQTQTLTPGVQAIYSFDNGENKHKITPGASSNGGEVLTVTEVPILQSNYQPPANFSTETCTPVEPFTTANGAATCVLYQWDCSVGGVPNGGDCLTMPYTLLESYNLPTGTTEGGPNLLVVHGKGCPTSSTDMAVSIFTEYNVNRIDPTKHGGGSGTGSCVESMETPGAPQITEGNWTGTAYVVNAGSNSVSVINTTTLIPSVATTVGVGSGPVNIAYAPTITSAYVANAGSNSVSVIDTATNTVASTVAVGSIPVNVAVTPDGTKAYVANSLSRSVSVINTSTNAVMATVTVGRNPLNVAIKPDGSAAYVANSGSKSVSVINTTTNTVTATVGVGSIPVNVAVTPDGTKAYVANSGSKSVSVINTSTNTVAATVKVGFDPVGVAISPDGTTAYVANALSNSVSVINTSSNTVTATIAVGFIPVNLTISPDGTQVYVVNAVSNSVSVISTASKTVVATVPVGVLPANAGFTGGNVYVANGGAKTVSVISTTTNSVTTTLSVGSNPVNVGVP